MMGGNYLDLSMILDKIDAGAYFTFPHFIRDINLIVNNFIECKSDPLKLANKAIAFFDEILNDVEDVDEDLKNFLEQVFKEERNKKISTSSTQSSTKFSTQSSTKLSTPEHQKNGIENNLNEENNNGSKNNITNNNHNDHNNNNYPNANINENKKNSSTRSASPKSSKKKEKEKEKERIGSVASNAIVSDKQLNALLKQILQKSCTFTSIEDIVNLGISLQNVIQTSNLSNNSTLTQSDFESSELYQHICKLISNKTQ